MKGIKVGRVDYSNYFEALLHLVKLDVSAVANNRALLRKRAVELAGLIGVIRKKS